MCPAKPIGCHKSPRNTLYQLPEAAQHWQAPPSQQLDTSADAAALFNSSCAHGPSSCMDIDCRLMQPGFSSHLSTGGVCLQAGPGSRAHRSRGPGVIQLAGQVVPRGLRQVSETHLLQLQQSSCQGEGAAWMAGRLVGQCTVSPP